MATIAMATELGHMAMQMLFILQGQSAQRGVCKERLRAVAPVNRANGYFCHSFALMFSFDH